MRPEVGQILTQDQVNYIRFGDYDSPQKILGRHLVDEGQVISFYHPYAREARVEFSDESYEMENIEKTNFFSAFVPHQKEKPYHIHLILENGQELDLRDPYSFKVQLKRRQIELWEKGEWQDVYRYLGAHPMTLNNISGVHFAVWAPNAKRVSVVGDFNHWDGRINPMIKRGIGGIFELFIPDVKKGMLYKYEIKTQMGEVYLKADPFANEYEIPPKNASIVTDFQRYQWNDRRWMEDRKYVDHYRNPVAIYEVHLGSWKRAGLYGEHYLSYKELAHQLAAYILDMGYTHVELLGILEHLRDETLGHEIYGFYAPTSRFGKIKELKAFVDYMHQHNIGVILDWTPVGMTKDPAGMSNFDGTPLYESTDSGKQKIMNWNNVPFDYSKKQVCNFMLSNAKFWMEEFHIDGFRIAALDGILYETYYSENRAGIKFMQMFTEMVNAQKNGCMIITEHIPRAYRSKIKVTFQWTGDHLEPLIEHLRKDGYAERELENQEINRFKKIDYSEKHIIKISHRFGENYGSMITQMPGDYFAKFANIKTLYGFIIGMRGKKHIFMGQDIGQWNQWDVHKSLDWHILGEDSNRNLQSYMMDLLHFYREHSTLYETDYEEDSFQWLIKIGASEIVSFARQNKETNEKLVFVCNFTPIDHQVFTIGMTEYEQYRQVFSSDATEYGGLGTLKNDVLETQKEMCDGFPYSLTLQLPKQSCIILQRQDLQ